MEGKKNTMLNEEETHNYGPFLDRTIRLMRLAVTKELRLAGTDITPEQWVILSSLYNEDGQSQSDLANDSFKNAPTVSRIIDLLCGKGYTERVRSEGDRRRYKVFLTPGGREVVEKALPAIVKTRRIGWQGLDDEDYLSLIRIINRIFANLEDYLPES